MAENYQVNIEVKSNLDDTNKNISKLKGNLKDTSTEAKKTGQNVSDISKSNNSIGSLGDSLGQLSPAFGNATKGANSLLTKMWLIVANPLGAIIVAIVGAVTLLFKAFTSTKDGADQLSQVMAGLGAVVDVLRDRILNVGNAIIKFFSGDFKGALNEGRKAVSDFGNEVASEFKKAANATKDLQQVEDAFNALSVSRAKVNRDLAISKELLTDENASYEQKKKALDLIKTTESKQTEQELANAKRKYEAIKALNALSDTSRENKKKEQDAEAALFSLQEQSARDRRSINKQEKLLLKQKKEDEKLAADAKKEQLKSIQDAEKEAIGKRFELEKLSFDERRKIVNEDKKLSAKDRKDFLDKINSEERKSVEDHNKAIADLNKRYDEEEENRLADTAVKKEELDYTRKLKEIESIAKTELEKQTLIEKLDTEHKARMTVAAKTDAEKKAADAKAIDDKRKEEETKAEQNKNAAIANSKQNLANIINGIETTGLAKTKAGQAISKALALTQIGIDSAVALSKASTLANAEGAAAQLAFPLVPGIGTIARVLSYTSTALSVASNIVRAKQLLSGGGGGGAASGGSSAPSPTGGGNAPQFNVVGATGVNQLAGAIANREQAPIETYVVANNVSTAMALDRNIIRSATLG